MIKVITDGRGIRSDIIRWTEGKYREFARARLSMDEGRGDVFELYLDDNGNLDLRQLPRYGESGEARTLYSSTAPERSARPR